jgi:hypothetical protein
MNRPRDTGALLAPVAVAFVAIVCCAVLPVLAGALGGLALATILGVGGGLIALIAAAGAIAVVLRLRRRRACRPTGQRAHK